MTATALLCLVLTGWTSACGPGAQSERRMELAADLFPTSYVDSTLEFPLLRFADGEQSINDRCPVRKVKLNRKLAPLFVNGRPLGFC